MCPGQSDTCVMTPSHHENPWVSLTREKWAVRSQLSAERLLREAVRGRKQMMRPGCVRSQPTGARCQPPCTNFPTARAPPSPRADAEIVQAQTESSRTCRMVEVKVSALLLQGLSTSCPEPSSLVRTPLLIYWHNSWLLPHRP